MTAKDFRRLALRMNDAVEGAHMGHPDFRARGKIFATLHPDGRQGMVKLTPGQQQEFLAAHDAIFTPASGAWGRQGCTMVRLDAADEETVGEAMTLAWQNLAPSEPSPRAKAPASRRARTSRPGARARQPRSRKR